MKKVKLLISLGVLVSGLVATPCVVKADGTESGSEAEGDKGVADNKEEEKPPKHYVEDGTVDKVFSNESAAKDYYVNTNSINFTYIAKDGTSKQEVISIDHATDIYIGGAFWQGDVSKVIVSNVDGVISATYMMNFASFNPVNPSNSTSQESAGTTVSSSHHSSGGYVYIPMTMPTFDYSNIFGGVNAVQAQTFDFNGMFGGVNPIQTPTVDFNSMFGGMNVVQAPVLDFNTMFGSMNIIQTPVFDFNNIFGGQDMMNFGFDLSSMWQMPGMEGFNQFGMENLLVDDVVSNIINGTNVQ